MDLRDVSFTVEPLSSNIAGTGKKRIDGPPPRHPRTHRSATSETMPALPKMDLQRAAA